MFDNLIGLGYGIIVFAILIGVGSVVLFNFGGSVASCPTSGFSWNATTATCTNSTGSSETPTGAAYDNTFYLMGQLGESGLAGWTPAIIAISVGLLFLGAFMIGGSKAKAGGRY